MNTTAPRLDLALALVIVLAAVPGSAAASFLSEIGVQPHVCNAAVLSGNLRHVALSGSDAAGDGSAAKPYRTLFRAAETAQPGDTIVVRQGTYAEPQEIRIRVANVAIRSFPGEWAVVDRRSETGQGSGIYFYVGADGGSLECIEVAGGFYAVSTETKWDWGDPDDRAGASRLRIANTKLHGSQRDVVKIKPNCDDISIEHNEIYDSGIGLSPDDCNAEGVDNVNGDRNRVAYNHIHDICSNGVYHKGGATDGVVEYNLIEDTGGAGILLGFDTSPEYFDLTVNPDYYENIRGVARYNLVRNTGGSGIGFYASREAAAHNNTIINAAKSYHGPIYFGVTFQDWDPEAGRPANRNPASYRNIVSQSATLAQPLVSIRYASELGGLSALSGTLNTHHICYWQAGHAAIFADGRTDFTGTFTQWRTHIGGEAGSLLTDPLLDADGLPHNPRCTGLGHAAMPPGSDVPARHLLLGGP
ncbi:right-handed parallel beta-helix repeat-containing protein [Desulfolutivibrio sp.]|uniref:right-handed parallel beta-helix repeat-containing protein n=1 Tax=Desulfolutivibrio sp. TaxID=2773296 RepID=UPI002F969932